MDLARRAWAAAALDVACVLIFVIIGRASHAKGETLPGIASTAWPFLAALGVGWVAARGWRRPLAIRPEGLVIWLCTVALGMVFRVVSGQGTAAAFIVVALAFLALSLLGWRLLARLAARTASRPSRTTASARRLGRPEPGRRKGSSVTVVLSAVGFT